MCTSSAASALCAEGLGHEQASSRLVLWLRVPAIAPAGQGVSVRDQQFPCKVKHCRSFHPSRHDLLNGPIQDDIVAVLHGLKICLTVCYCTLIVGTLAVVFLRLRAVEPPYRRLKFPEGSCSQSARLTAAASLLAVSISGIGPPDLQSPASVSPVSEPSAPMPNHPPGPTGSRAKPRVTFAVICTDL